MADTPGDADPKPAKPAKPAKPKASKKEKEAEVAAQLEELRQALQAQQEQLQLLKEELAKRDRQINEAKDAATAANSRATEATVKATEAVNSAAEVKANEASLTSSVNDLKTSNETLTTNVATVSKSVAAAPQNGGEEGPATIRYKGISITPGGFIAAETAFRTHSTESDIATPFTSTPFAASDLSHVTENAFTGRQSRLSLMAQSDFGSVTTKGYYEADFLGVGANSNNRQSNSYVFRQRQLWAQAAFNNGFSITGGQMWSLATESKKGMMNLQEDTPAVIDPNYVVGFTWARQYGARFVQKFGDKFAVGVSAEGPQATIGGRGFSAVTNLTLTSAPSVIVTSGSLSSVTGNFFINGPGSGGGAYNGFDSNGYTFNKSPDIIFKATADPGFGHYEVFGIVSIFRDRVYPCGVVGTNTKDTVPGTTTFTGNCTSPTPTVVSSYGATNLSTTGGGGGVSALFPLFNKHLDFDVKAVAGDGIGRYGAAQLADATARPDGSLALIRTAHGLGRLDWHVTHKFDLYSYWGLEYAWRAGYKGYDSITVTKTAAAAGGLIPATLTTTISTTGIGGYGNFAANNSGCATESVTVNDFNPSTGSSSTCAGDIRIIQEATLGFWYKFYQGSKGRMQFGMTYSYLAKDAWSGTGGVAAGGAAISPKGINNMIFTSFRYYIP